MASFNKTLLIGNLTRDPEVRFLASGSAVASFGLACNHRYKSNDEVKEEVMFIDCEAWGKTAELIGQYLTKGRPVHIEGRLKLDSWEDKDGGKRSKHKIVVASVQFLGQGGGSDQSAKPAKRESAPSAPASGDDEPPF